jgi:hypothetical protein
MFVRKHEDCGAVGEGFTELLGKGRGDDEIGAVATMIVMKGGFIHTEMAVEVEVDALV